MNTRQAKKILRYINSCTHHKRSRYWFTRLWFYKGWRPNLGDNDFSRKDHRITKALQVYQRHGRIHHPLAQR